jgi:IS30 family transposase
MIGKNNRSAIGTLVERATGYAILVSLPDGYKPEQLAPALTAKIQTLAETLRRSLTWDQGPQVRGWKRIRSDTASKFTSATPRPLAARQQREHQRAAAPIHT